MPKPPPFISRPNVLFRVTFDALNPDHEPGIGSTMELLALAEKINSALWNDGPECGSFNTSELADHHFEPSTAVLP